MDAGPALTPIQQKPCANASPCFWCVLIIAAVLLRVVIAAVSTGTNDARLFWLFASEIRQFGIVPTYGIDGLFNHPPLVAAWIKLADWLATHGPSPFGAFQAFTFIFKLPVISADALGAWLIWKIWQPRVGTARAAAIAAATAWSLCSILISGFHCNTDPMYAVLCLAVVYFMEERKAFFLAGLALGAAINVKIVPVLLIPGLVLSCRSFREARLFIAGLAVGVIPFLPVLWSEAPSFVHNALAYNSNRNNWGIMFLLLAGKTWHGAIGSTSPAVETFHDLGRYLVFISIGGWAVVARIANRWTRYEIAAATFAIFLVLTPGFGVQYLAMIVPLLFAIRPRIAVLYATASGAFAFALYFTHLQPHAFPLQSVLGRFPLAESMLGLVAWTILAAFLVITFRGKPIARTDKSNTGQPLPVSYTSARAA
jgi:hypothetical protein